MFLLYMDPSYTSFALFVQLEHKCKLETWKENFGWISIKNRWWKVSKMKAEMWTTETERLISVGPQSMGEIRWWMK